MPISVRLKFWLFEHYWWLLCCSVALTVIIILFVLREPLTTFVTVMGSLLSVAYFLQKQKLEEMRLFRELFKECNGRYDAMNEALASIANKGDVELCFRRGYIEPSVWQAWNKGMKVIVAAPPIQRVWQEEKSSGSYYDLPL